MRRFFFGLFWFLVFSFGGLMIAGGIVGGIAGGKVEEKKTLSEGYSAGYDAGHAAGQEFGQKYGSYFFLGGLVLSITGSMLGILPGTKPRKAQQDTGV